MCHMAWTDNKVHIRVFQYPTFNWVSFNHIHRYFIYRETDTLIWFCVITLSDFPKLYATVAPFVGHISSKLLVTLPKEMSNIFTVKGFNLVKSESLLPSAAKVYGLVFILYTRSTRNLCVNTLFTTMQKVLVLAHWYCFAICESGNIFLNNGSYLLGIVQQSENGFHQ